MYCEAVQFRFILIINKEIITDKMERLIPITNNLQEILEILSLGASNEDIHGDRQVLTIDLPQIAVVGAQSVGKSSLLEFIIGKE